MTFTSIESKDFINSALSDHVCKIQFTKKNGDLREMYCTLNMEKIPLDMQPTGNSNRKASTDARSVFDVETKEWRAFRWDSIQAFEYSLVGDILPEYHNV